tara:strand:- start:727 stop:1170 length:444 start_codon:yes stop_codon:yes gene_type:complete
MRELSDFDEMYQEVIIDHYKNPRNKSKLPKFTDEIMSHNPFCGDEIELQLNVQDDVIQAVSVDGRGCAISQSSGSLLGETIVGKTIIEAKNDNNSMRSLLKNEDLSDKQFDSLEDSSVIEGVKKFPVRIKCALLSWSALNDILSKYQ